MNVVLDIRDELASRLSSEERDLGRQALEAFMLENYCVGRLTFDELGTALGLAAQDEIDGFLKAHGFYENYGLDDLKRDRQTLDELGL